MPSSLRVKLARPNGTTRIAVFAEEPTWHDLIARAHAFFDIPEDCINLSYIDGDGDEITLTSPNELQEQELFSRPNSGRGASATWKLTVRDTREHREVRSTFGLSLVRSTHCTQSAGPSGEQVVPRDGYPPPAYSYPFMHTVFSQSGSSGLFDQGGRGAFPGPPSGDPRAYMHLPPADHRAYMHLPPSSTDPRTSISLPPASFPYSAAQQGASGFPPHSGPGAFGMGRGRGDVSPFGGPGFGVPGEAPMGTGMGPDSEGHREHMGAAYDDRRWSMSMSEASESVVFEGVPAVVSAATGN